MKVENKEELLKLIALLRKNGVESFKSGDIELKISTSALFPESAYKRKKKDSQKAPLLPADLPENEEAVLFWSSQVSEGIN